ncbi:esterase family protein [Nocardia higoensis]|uniref:Esterase family protein n=1 Tax=Nocardia higoensis TaxID=228599 RepID=A0ABS0D924_9NOCA|nr:alpha/beta hydrolase family protein [Nocardia higoensis]MBF6354964.1 esterase family protein [Nocardia higoensis]
MVGFGFTGRRSFGAAVAAAALFLGGLGPARAEGPEPAVTDIRQGTERALTVEVFSPAMKGTTEVLVLRAADPTRPAPTLYLLNGASGHVDGSWHDSTDYQSYFAGKQVNVVIPLGGAGSYFTDWRSEDPVLGTQRWGTFLTEELPPLIDEKFGGNGANAVVGVSMSGTSVFQLALGAPGLYRAIGSFSGCVRTSDLQGQVMVNAVVAAHRGNPVNMWGPPDDPTWQANDPYLHAEGLRGTEIYISSGSGIPGPYDSPTAVGGDQSELGYRLLFGAPLEAVTNMCTLQLRERLRELGIPATIDLRPTGTHAWDYWQEDLHKAWPVFEAALNR